MSRLVLSLTAALTLSGCPIAPHAGSCPDEACSIEEELQPGTTWEVFDNRCDAGEDCLQDAEVRLEEDRLVLSYVDANRDIVEQACAYDPVAR